MKPVCTKTFNHNTTIPATLICSSYYAGCFYNMTVRDQFVTQVLDHNLILFLNANGILNYV